MSISLIKNSDLKHDNCLEVIEQEEVGATKILLDYLKEMFVVYGCPLSSTEDRLYSDYMHEITSSLSLNKLANSVDWMMKAYGESLCYTRQLKGSNFLSALEKEKELFNNKTKECKEKIEKETKIAQEIAQIDAKYLVDLSNYHANFVGVADLSDEAEAP
jgi:hypothetical protein